MAVTIVLSGMLFSCGGAAEGGLAGHSLGTIDEMADGYAEIARLPGSERAMNASRARTHTVQRQVGREVRP